MMYNEIDKRPTVRESYMEHLISLGELSQGGGRRDSAEPAEQYFEEEFDKWQSLATKTAGDPSSLFTPPHGPYVGGLDSLVEEVETGVPLDRLQKLGKQLVRMPVDFVAHRKIVRLLKSRREMYAGQSAA